MNDIIPSKYKEIGYFWVPALGSRSPRYLNLLLAIFDGLKYFYILPDFRKWVKLPYQEFVESVSVALIIQDPNYTQFQKKPKGSDMHHVAKLVKMKALRL